MQICMQMFIFGWNIPLTAFSFFLCVSDGHPDQCRLYCILGALRVHQSLDHVSL